MDKLRKKMQNEWTANTKIYGTPIGMTGRRPHEAEFQATVDDLRAKIDLEGPGISAVLDVGCNNGYLLKSLNPAAEILVGVDFCQAPILKGKEMFSDIHFLQGEITELPFPDQAFDRVLCYNMFHYLPSPEIGLKAVRELFRVLTPNGELLIGDLFTLEHKDAIPEEDQARWNAKDRPFMHRMENWMFMPVAQMECLFRELGADSRVLPQYGALRCQEYRFDVWARKSRSN